MENLVEEKRTLGNEILEQLATEALSSARTLKSVKLKVTLDGKDRGYLGFDKKRSGDKLICDVSKSDATVFNVKQTKYTKKDHFTYEIANGPYKGRWLDYHTGSGELFAESHKFFEVDIAIWQYKDHKLQALIGKKTGELPVCGESDSVLTYASLRMEAFKVFEE